MVREFGLSAELGPVGYPDGGSVFLGGGGAGFSSRPFAEATQAAIDSEVASLLREAERRAVQLLTDHRSELRRLTEALIAKETLDGAEVYAIAGVPEPTGLVAGTTVAPQRAAAGDTTALQATEGHSQSRS
jgi:cell division protease FtsH